MASVTETIDIKATPQACYDVITDYKNYPQFVEGVTAISVKKQKGESAEVTFIFNLVKSISYTLAMKGEPPHRLQWTFVKGDMMRDNTGFWDLQEIKKGVTHATYQLNVELGLLVPSAVTKSLIGKSLPSMLRAFKKRIENGV